jgi:putative membrane protein
MTLTPSLILIGSAPAAVIGALVGALAGCIPALHIYNLLAAGMLLTGGLLNGIIPATWMDASITGMIVGWVIVNSLPAILLSSPDESALFTVLPGHRYLMDGRGFEAVLLTATGAAGAIAALLLGSFFVPRLLPTIHTVLSPHYHWIIWTVIAFMLLSEWPQGRTAALPPLQRLLSGTRNATMGLLTFTLSGLLGFILLYRPALVSAPSGQTLLPAFAGLFAMPWLIMNVIGRVRPPPQQTTARLLMTPRELLHGITAGTLGGAFAAVVPVVSGGIGGMLAGHATTLREERAFLISQGASKVVYYAGALLLWFVPGLHLARGGGAALLRSLHPPVPDSYGIIVAVIAIAAATALITLPFFARRLIHLINRFGHNAVSWIALAIILLVVGLMTGPRGWLVMTVATGIGLIPALSGARRMNSLGIILLPLACNMSGIGPAIARFLGVL